MPTRIREFRNGTRGRWLAEQAIAVAASLLMVGGVTVLIALALLIYKIDHVTILYLIPVLASALRWGILPAVVAAVAGAAAPAFFFYPPIFDFRVSNPDQIIDLVLFTIVAVVTGHLAVMVRQAKMRAQAESLRDALISSVSHELRTPLASIVGSASILARAPAVDRDEQLSSLVRVMRDEAERLNGDIQNLVDATRISSEGIQPHWEWVDPEDIVNGALARKRWILADRSVALAIADDLPFVYVDATLIESAVGQLIENAAKYSRPGTPISIGAEQVGNTIQVKIADKGEGLAFGEAERIFGRFYRSPRHAGAIPGSGLGLWIARALIEACGGRVQAFSPGPGKARRCGSTFRSRPSLQPTSALMSEMSPVVLIIDDDLQIRRFLRAGFDIEHFTVLEEETGQAGLRTATLRPVDLIVLDLNLPDIDGASIVERIRAWSTVPIIVLSVRASDTDKVKLLEAGADDYVVKPFSMVELVARARAALRRHTRGAQHEQIVKLGTLSIDLANRAVFVNGARVVLSPKEYRLLQVLAQHAGNVVTHNVLLKEVWGVRNLQNAHYLRILVRRLRRKIEQNPKQPRILMSELGVGYRLASGDAD